MSSSGRITMMACLLMMMVMVNTIGAQHYTHGRNDNHQQRSSHSRSISHQQAGTTFTSPSSHALGIQQPSAHALGGQGRSPRFWWKDPSSNGPFSEGAGKRVGVRSAAILTDNPRAHSRPDQAFIQQTFATQATAYSSPGVGQAGAAYSGNNVGGGAQQQQQWAPLPPFPGCAAALKCVEEQFCDINGVMGDTPINPQLKEFRVPLMPCLNVETNKEGFCCRDPLYEDPWPADMPMPGMAAKPSPAAVNNININRPPPPAVSASASVSSVSQQYLPPQPQPVQPPTTAYLPPQAVPAPSQPQPVNIQPHQPVQPAPRPPAPAPTFNTNPPPQPQRPVNPPPPQQPWTGPFAPVEPFPGCAAALKCVQEQFCDITGVMVNQPVQLSEFEKTYLRPPLMECLNTDTNQVGFCCRDPLYDDPWPADMPMPANMPPKPAPSQPQPQAVRPPQQQIAPVQQQQQGYNYPQPQPAFNLPAPVQQQTYTPPVQVQQPAFKPLEPQYTPPVQQQINTQPAYTPQPSQFQQQTAARPVQPPQEYKPWPGPFAEDVAPYPGCASALKCVDNSDLCDINGIMSNTPINPLLKAYRVPLSRCLNTETNKEGVCCRDPLYEDPWPADMPMPGMAPKHG